MNYELVDFIPEQLKEGILYISEPYKTAAHKCCCGCGEEVITPLNLTDWKVKIQGNRVTLHPSIGNWSFACRSHYWIRNGEIVWSYQMSEKEIQRGRNHDKTLKQAYFKQVNQEKQTQPLQSDHPTILRWLDNVLKKLISWLKK